MSTKVVYRTKLPDVPRSRFKRFIGRLRYFRMVLRHGLPPRGHRWW